MRTLEQTIAAIILDVCELPDRTSPDDAPDDVTLSVTELQTILERHLTDDSKAIERSLILAADLLGGMKRAAASANIFGRVCDAYSGAEATMRQLAKRAKSGDEIRDNNGLVWRAAVEAPAGA